VDKTPCELIEQQGMQCETHYVHTLDGYVLTTFHIPPSKPGSRVVVLQHGIEDSCYTWINGAHRNESLGFILHDMGLDVWLPNSRGNAFSQNSTKYPVNSDEFWDFSFDEMAEYDLPATITYVLAFTHKEKLSLVGHSQGCTMTLAAMANHSAIASHIDLFIALAPVTYLEHCGSLLINVLAKLDVDYILELLGCRQFMPSSGILEHLFPLVCKVLPSGCDDILSLITGPTKTLNGAWVYL
jgi:pimeloyl-ACP methyl ester carboxylesterase